MPFEPAPSGKGQIWVPEPDGAEKRQPCRDCQVCAQCGQSRCRVCRRIQKQAATQCASHVDNSSCAAGPTSL